jgi:hypothetical protein
MQGHGKITEAHGEILHGTDHSQEVPACQFRHSHDSSVLMAQMQCLYVIHKRLDILYTRRNVPVWRIRWCILAEVVVRGTSHDSPHEASKVPMLILLFCLQKCFQETLQSLSVHSYRD